MNRIPFCLLMGVFTVLSLSAGPIALGAMGEIKTPMLLVKDQPDTQAALEKVLRRPDAKYLQGHWLNRWSSLQYGGDTTALNMMIADLALCPGLEVTVRFQKLENDASWIIGQEANAPKVQVTVNLGSSQIEPERISLPSWSGPGPRKR